MQVQIFSLVILSTTAAAAAFAQSGAILFGLAAGVLGVTAACIYLGIYIADVTVSKVVPSHL